MPAHIEGMKEMEAGGHDQLHPIERSTIIVETARAAERN